MKTSLHHFLKQRKCTSREIAKRRYGQSSSSLTIYKRMVTKTSNKLFQVIIWQTCSRRPFPLQRLKRVSKFGGSYISTKLHCTLFPLTMLFSHWVFLGKVFNETMYNDRS